MYNSGGQPLIANCVFSGNVVSGSGGGLYNQGVCGGVGQLPCSVTTPVPMGEVAEVESGRPSGTLTLTNCTVSGNHCSWGGGLWINGDTTLNNCIFWGNTGGERIADRG